MDERRCRYCQKVFQPSKYQPLQAVCSEKACQQQRRIEYRRQKLTIDKEYRQVCQDSSRKWRSRNPDYWKQYREKHPDAVTRNRDLTAKGLQGATYDEPYFIAQLKIEGDR